MCIFLKANQSKQNWWWSVTHIRVVSEFSYSAVHIFFHSSASANRASSSMNSRFVFLLFVLALSSTGSCEKLFIGRAKAVECSVNVPQNFKNSVLGGTNQPEFETHAGLNRTGTEGFEAVNYLFEPLQSKPVSNVLGLSTASDRVWPTLKFSWRIVVATIIGFVGSACGTVGGVGGGGIFVPMLNLIVGFDTKSAAALSKCMIMGASTSSVWYNLRVRHPARDVPIIDYDLALFFQPMLMMGITAGVTLSVIFPYWLITTLIIILFIGTSSRSFFKGIEMWKKETKIKNEEEATPILATQDVDYEAIPSDQDRNGTLETICFNIRWKGLSILMVVWISFLILQIFKNGSVVCGVEYWIVNALQIPVAFGVCIYEAIFLYKSSKSKRRCGDTDNVCEASVEWGATVLVLCATCGIVGGIVGGLLGSGGGFILGPLLLEIGVIPQVASATATFVMMFSSSLSVVEFYFLDRFPLPYALYLMSVSILAGFWGQYILRKLVTILGRASIIVFILSGVIFISAITMGAVGIERSIHMIHEKEYMGFFNLCQES